MKNGIKPSDHQTIRLLDYQTTRLPDYMFLSIDIGNTNIVFGVFDSESLLAHWRIRTDTLKTSDEYGVLIQQLIGNVPREEGGITDSAIASVVPSLTNVIYNAVNNYIFVKPLIIDSNTDTGITIKYKIPSEVGIDRIVNAVAVYEIYGSPAIVVDLGTATTFDVVSEDREYLGGAIVPGIRTAAENLFKSAARLFSVELKKPPSVIGKTTEESMQSGIIYGAVEQIDGLVRRIEKEWGKKAKVIATGGLADLIVGESQTIQQIDPWLTLKGIKIIYQRCKK